MSHMTRVILLVPPDRAGFVRDTYYGCWHKRKFVNYSWPPLMLYYLHALIPDSVVIDAPAHNLDEERTIRELASLSPGLVLTSVGTFTIREDAPFLRRIRDEAGCATALFGEFATTNSRAASQLSDIVISGEPEAALPKLSAVLSQQAPSGIIKAGIIKNLDTLPFPRRVLEERELYFNPFAKRSPFTTVLASRGCPFECNFCTVPLMYGRTFRARSADNVLEELALLEEQGFKEVFFRDENLTLDKRFLTRLCQGMINSGIGLRWMANSRVDTVDKDVLALMHEAGCHLLKFGVESLSDASLARLKKGTNMQDIRKAFSLCEKIGIDSMAHMMLGCPGETEEQVKKNIEGVICLDPTYASFDVVLAYPGTGLAEMAAEGGTTGIPRERLERIHDSAFKRFYLRPYIIRRHLLNVDSWEEMLWKAKSTVQLWKGLLNWNHTH